MRSLFGITVVGICICLMAVWALATPGTATPMVEATYTDDGLLVRPQGYRLWVSVGASLGLSYFGEKPPARPEVFHHVYMQREAFDHYVETGAFAEKTMLVMENYSAGKKDSENISGHEEFKILHGQYEHELVGVEVALKDSKRFNDGWAYFNFSNNGGPLKETAKAFPKAMCWNCHNEHAADDNVFIQFYPPLREVFEARTGQKK